MITFWQQADGKLVRKEKDELASGMNTWVDARSVTREDITFLEKEYTIEPDHILDILDPDELSRIEAADYYTLTIVRLPVFVPSAEVCYFTVPLGIVLFQNVIITICWTDCEVLRDFSDNRIKELSLTDFPAFIIRILSRSDTTFLRYLKEINRRSTSIQNELQLTVENNEIIQLLNLQKSLVLFTTSLKSNQLLLEKFRKTRLIKLDEDDKDWLDDVEIDSRQALEMADTYSGILSRMIEAFTSIISNNMNAVMKKLTLISVIMMVPTFITSYYGMNIPLPLAQLGWTGTMVISMFCLVSSVATSFFLRDKKSPGKRKLFSAKNIRRRLNERKLQKEFEAQEEKLEELS
jgi:magnesium transporter